MRTATRWPLAVGVLMVAACAGGESAPRATAGPGDVAVDAFDIYYELDGQKSSEVAVTYTADAGSVEIVLSNQGVTVHNVVVEEADDTNVVEASGGELARGSIELEPGTYTLYCDIAGHREAGMVATLEVDG